MSMGKRISISIAILLAGALLCVIGLFAEPAESAAKDRSVVDIPELQMKHVALVEVLAVNAPAWQAGSSASGQETRTLHVTLRLQSALLGELSVPAGGQLEVPVEQSRQRAGIVWDNPLFWSNRELKVGQRYLVFSQQTTHDLAVLFQQPERVEEVRDEVAVDDLRFMILHKAEPKPQQADALAAWLHDSEVSHTWYIGAYAAALLAGTPADQSAKLRTVLEDRAHEKLSENGRHGLVVGLSQRMNDKESADSGLLKLLTVETIRSVVGNESAATPQSKKIQLDTVENYLPGIVGSERARQLLHGDVLDRAERVRTLAVVNQLSGSGKFSPKNREALVALAGILENRN